MYYPFIEIDRKSMKIDNKFIENQWKLNEISDKIDPNSSQNWVKLRSNPDQILGWDNKMNNGFGLRGHEVIMTSITKFKMLGGDEP